VIGNLKLINKNKLMSTTYIRCQGLKSFGLLVLTGIILQLELPAQQIAPFAYSGTIPGNYIRTWDALVPISHIDTLLARPFADVRQTTAYFDGLGRPLQTVVKKGSMETGGTATDLVSPVVYDRFGRKQYQYLPFAANNTGGNTSISDGLFKFNPFQQDSAFNKGMFSDETYYYSKAIFEASPLNRTGETYAPGNNWVGTASQGSEANRRGIKVKSWINTVTDSVRIWTVTNVSNNFGAYATSSSYAAGLLYKNVTQDEHNKQVIEFKDKEGKVILKKVQLTAAEDDGNGKGYYGWLCTYYVYDDFNNLRAVIQPKGVEAIVSGSWSLTSTLLEEQCFRYEYDAWNRMILKKVPGAGTVYMVYDAKDRLVMTQDSMMRSGSDKKWLYTLYDELNRPTITGLITDNTNNASYHRGQAESSTAYPNPASYTNEELTRTFYDSYDWLSTHGNPFSSTRYTGNDYAFLTPSGSYPYPQAMTQSFRVAGMVTGTKTKVIGTSSQYLYSISYYDDEGRVIQVQDHNVSGCGNITSFQYSFSGQILVTHEEVNKCGSPNLHSWTTTKYEYDDLGRLLTLKKHITDGTVSAGEKTIAQNEYDALGQLKKKKLAPVYNSNAGLETLNYDYNIRGWMLGLNRNFLKNSNAGGYEQRYFGFELGYDKAGTVAGQNFNNTPQYNGNIVGTVWKSKGDDVRRKYDFGYDAVNRFNWAEFTQNNIPGSGGTWNSTDANFSVHGLDADNSYRIKYDANGNLLQMVHRGWKLGEPDAWIDGLQYTYHDNSNKLKNVIDQNNVTDTKLGDFRYSTLYNTALGGTKTSSAVDYTYDGNGNLKKDRNKDIGDGSNDGIVYNHLNLPQTITVRTTAGAVKGIIEYGYDAAGTKLKKTTYEPGVDTTTTLYIGATVYQNDVLQFISTEEGRIRFDAVDSSFQFDYFIKDHLGNVRMVLTEQQQTDAYLNASMEYADSALQNLYYNNIHTTRVAKPSGYPSDTYTNPNNYVAKVRGDGNKIGPAIILKVMAGDKFNLRVNSWYKTNGTSSGTPTDGVTDVINAISNGIAGKSGGKVTAGQLQGWSGFGDLIEFFMDQQKINSDPTKPRAYVSWIAFDEQFKYEYQSSGFEEVGNNEEFKTHLRSDLTLTKSGYLYIYVSNETPNIDVFFDNFQITHTRGPLLEETHYYPFGLTMSGISSKALNNSPQNKYKFNDGTELANKEFSDGSGLEMYETPFRGYDPQIGRFDQIDPLAEGTDNWTPYAFCNNNPILFNDPLGLDTTISINGAQTTVTDSELSYGVTVSAKKGASSASTPLPSFGAVLAPAVTLGSRGGVIGLGIAVGYSALSYGINGPTLQESLEEARRLSHERMLQWARETVRRHAAILAALAALGGPNEKLYELYAAVPGLYSYLRGGRFWKMFEKEDVLLNAGDIWKYGTTKQPYVIGGPGQYPARYSPGSVEPGIRSREVYSGTRLQVYAMQAYYIAQYFLAHGDLPPGNKAIF
jgi:RHS repeat-associated protein